MATQGVPLWSKTASSNATADPAVSWPEGMSPSQVNDSARAEMASVAKWRDDLYGLTTGGTSTAYTVTTNATYASASDMSGAIFTIIPNATSGASPTLAVDGLTARAINISTGVAVPTGYLVSGTPYLIKYVHASTEFIVLGQAGKNTLAALDIITGTSETSIATGDTIPFYDLSAAANRRMLVSDFLKVVNALTEDTSPDSSADFVMSYDTSATAAKKIKLSNMPSALPRGYIDGCILSNGTDATNDIDIAGGVCRDSTDSADITVPAISGKQLDANWAAGGSAGMRNSGAGIADTTYHIYAIRTATSATADIYAHTSTTVATVLTALQAEPGGSSYVYARRIGSIVRSSSSIRAFVQYGDDFYLKVPILTVNAQSQNTTASSRTMDVPTGIAVKAYLNARTGGVNTIGYLYISPLSTTDTGASTALGTGGGASSDGGINSTGFGAGQVSCWTDTSGQVRTVCSGSLTIYISTLGWRDPRGKEA